MSENCHKRKSLPHDAAASSICAARFEKAQSSAPRGTAAGVLFEVEREHFDDEDDSDEDVAPGR